MADDNHEEDLFDDLYDDEVPAPKPAPAAPAPQAEPEPMKTEPESGPALDSAQNGAESSTPSWQAPQAKNEDTQMDHSGYNGSGDHSYGNVATEEDNYGPINVKEDG